METDRIIWSVLIVLRYQKGFAGGGQLTECDRIPPVCIFRITKQFFYNIETAYRGSDIDDACA